MLSKAAGGKKPVAEFFALHQFTAQKEKPGSEFFYAHRKLL